MKRTTKYVALDVHQASTVASVRQEGGRVIARTIVPTEEAAIVEFVRGMRGAIHVVFEEGTQAQWLHELLAPLVDRVVVCDRRGQPRHGNKGDQVDADELSEQFRRGGLRAVYHGSAHRAARPRVPESGRGQHTGHAPAQGAVPRPGDQDARQGRVSPEGAGGVAGAVAGARGTVPGGGPLRRTGRAADAEADGQGGDARRGPARSGWPVLRSIPFLGPVRVALLLATMQTPWRFRTKRNLWAYAGLAVVTQSSADYTFVAGQLVRRRRAPLTRGPNPNHNRVLKDVFKGAATAAAVRPGPLQDFYHGMLARGMPKELARVTLARKLAGITLRLWKKGEHYDPAKLTTQAR